MERHFSGHVELSLTRAIADVASVGGPRAEDLLARWAMDPRFTAEDRDTAIRALAAIDVDRAAELRQPDRWSKPRL